MKSLRADQFATAVGFVALVFFGAAPAGGQTAGNPVAYVGQGGTDTDPQSKCWYAQGSWWCALLDGDDTYLWRWDGHSNWSKQSVPGIVSAANSGRADCLSAGNTVYMALTSSGSTSIYKFAWDGVNYEKAPGWSTPVTLFLGAGTAVIARDSTGRLLAGGRREQLHPDRSVLHHDG